MTAANPNAPLDATQASAAPDLNQLTQQARAGDLQAKAELIRQLYPKLRSIAHHRLSGHIAPTLLNTTVLLHESLAKLLEQGFGKIESSQHLVAYAATVMRTVLVDYARERNAKKREAGERVSITHLELRTEDRSVDIVALDQALNTLTQIDPRLTAIVELRCFAGLTTPEIAAELGISERTVKRDWQKARAVLLTYFDAETTAGHSTGARTEDHVNRRNEDGNAS
jgi:RNA polymerase sigma factor (TIGR02999 family)